MAITTITGIRKYLAENSGFAEKTVKNVILTLDYPLYGKGVYFKELSATFADCAKHGAQAGFSGFATTRDTIAFFQENRLDIAAHMETTACELGTDIISMVKNFGAFRNSQKPTASQVGKALWCSLHHHELNHLYNLYAWYVLEELSHTWLRYLEENPAQRTKQSA